MLRIILLSLLVNYTGGGFQPAYSDTTFIGSTIEALDAEGQHVTIRTAEGKSWSLQVASADLIKGLKKGDRVSLELGPDDRVNKIIKTESETPSPSSPKESEY